MAANLHPTYDNVIVVPINEEEIPSAIILPDNVKKQGIKKAKVVAQGPGKLTDGGVTVPLPFEEGDEVMHGSFSGFKMKIGKQEYIVLKAEEIFCVVKPEKKAKA